MEREGYFEQEPITAHDCLEKLIGENFNRQKTFELERESDENNHPRELGEYQVFWTELINPDTNEVVEGKIYFPKDSQNIKKILIICPGYKGDFVLQEAYYADQFAKEGRAVCVLRHNGIRTQGEEMQNYIHCPEKQEKAQKEGQDYLGLGKDFSYSQAGREVLTALQAFGASADKLDSIDILGHSWGGRIAIQSIVELQKENSHTATTVKEKVKNLILLAPWLETRKDLMENKYRQMLSSDEQNQSLRGMTADAVLSDLRSTSQKIEDLTSQDFPPDLKIVGIESVTDEYTMGPEYQEEEYKNLNSGLQGFFKRIKSHPRIGNIVLKDLSGISGYPLKIGNRNPEIHDYHLEGGQIRKIISQIIN